MTYIQDKLDAISKKCASNIILSLSLPDEMIDYVERTITKNVQQSLTDYHNHIVEEVREKIDLDDRGGEYLMGYNSAISDVETLLQDTNPKE